jgi:hypothetical protein
MPPAAIRRVLNSGPFRFACRLGVATLVLIVLLYCGLRAYTVYLTHRAVLVLDEAARIQVGSTERSILPFVARYGAVKWKPQQPISTNDCPDKASCERFNANLPDYAYEVDIAPFNVLSVTPPQTGRFRRVLTFLMIQTPSSLRNPISLRDWLTEVQICIRGGHVVNVYSSVFVEGRNRWLGSTWELSSDEHDNGVPPKAYEVHGTDLSFPGNGGAGVLQFLTPAATAEQALAAHSFDARCLTGFMPCRRLCDLSPRAFQYINQHPEVSNIVRTDDCLSRSNP